MCVRPTVSEFDRTFQIPAPSSPLVQRHTVLIFLCNLSMEMTPSIVPYGPDMKDNFINSMVINILCSAGRQTGQVMTYASVFRVLLDDDGCAPTLSTVSLSILWGDAKCGMRQNTEWNRTGQDCW